MSASSTVISVYDQPHQFEPLLPSAGQEELVQRSRTVVQAALQLHGATHETTRTQLRELMRSMNSYYSNRIEGQSTHPLHIEQALQQKLSDQPDVAQRQRLALAHIQAEQELEALAVNEATALSSHFLQMAHAALYSKLSENERRTEQGHWVQPGVLRQQDVAVYRHQPPAWQAVPAFLQRADQVYAQSQGLDSLLTTVACAHHRLVWTHPFLDGNGRAARLQIHCALQNLSAGLWSVNRGLARQREAYYVALSNADMARHGDLDGRGNLSQKMLIEWCKFFIGVCEDQVAFMGKMLHLNELKQRIHALVLVRSQTHPDYRPSGALALHHVVAAGPVSRGEFVQLTGLGERTGRKMLGQLLKDGLLLSKSAKGEVGIGLPLDALGLLFPNLYPEAASHV